MGLQQTAGQLEAEWFGAMVSIQEPLEGTGTSVRGCLESWLRFPVLPLDAPGGPGDLGAGLLETAAQRGPRRAAPAAWRPGTWAPRRAGPLPAAGAVVCLAEVCPPPVGQQPGGITRTLSRCMVGAMFVSVQFLISVLSFCSKSEHGGNQQLTRTQSDEDNAIIRLGCRSWGMNISCATFPGPDVEVFSP